MKRRAFAWVLLALAIALGGCSSQDFGSYSGSLTDIVDSGKPYVPPEGQDLAKVRAEHLAELLVAWEKKRGKEDRDYRVGPDDILDIGVLSLDDPGEITALSRTIRQDGNITLPLVGDIEVGGKSPRELETLITSAYKGKYLKDPSVTVRVAEYRSAPVVVTGAVTHPGVYYLRHNVSSVLEVLGQVDGLAPAAGKELVIVRGKRKSAPSPDSGDPGTEEAPPPPPTPPPLASSTPRLPADIPVDQQGPMMADGGLESALPSGSPIVPASGAVSPSAPEMITVNLHGLLVEGDIRHNVTIEGGDIVTVPPAQAKYVYVLGYVQRPGAFPLRQSDRIRALQAVAMAGGLSRSARSQNSYLITETKAGRKVIDIDLSKIARGIRPPLYLESGDTLIVGSGLLAKLGEFINPSLGASASYSPVP